MHSFTMLTRIWIWKCFNLVPFTRAKSSWVLHTFFFNECTKNLNHVKLTIELMKCCKEWCPNISALYRVLNRKVFIQTKKTEICKQTWNALVNRSSFLPSRGVLLGGRWLNPLTPRSVMKKTWSLVLTFYKSVEKNLWCSNEISHTVFSHGSIILFRT